MAQGACTAFEHGAREFAVPANSAIQTRNCVPHGGAHIRDRARTPECAPTVTL
jgi:hypothetical protein